MSSCSKKLWTRGNILKRLHNINVGLPLVIKELISEYALIDYVVMIDKLRLETFRIEHGNYVLELERTKVVLKSLMRRNSFCIGIATFECSSFEFLRFLVDDRSFLSQEIKNELTIQCYRNKTCAILNKLYSQ
jgi:hypothetical protein